MSKRFTDTDKWRKGWFRKLTPIEKTAWFYITEQCDNVGVWDVDIELAEFVIGGKVDWENFIEKTNGNIEIIGDDKWWLVDFCAFQHTDLSPESKSKSIISYIKLLKKHGLYDRVIKGLARPLEDPCKGPRVKERVRVRVKEREKEREKAKASKGLEKVKYAEYVSMTEAERKKLIALIGDNNTKACITKLNDYKGAKGKRYKSDYLAIRNWVINEVTGEPTSAWEMKRRQVEVPLCPSCGKKLSNEARHHASSCYGCGADIRGIWNDKII